MKTMYIAITDVKNGDSFWGLHSEDLEKVRKDIASTYSHHTKSERDKSTYYVVGYEYPDDMDFNDWMDEQMCLPDPSFYEVCFEKWYAVQENTDDSWDYGSFNLEEAKRMMADLKEAGNEEALIAVIENDVCIEEIRE